MQGCCSVSCLVCEEQYLPASDYLYWGFVTICKNAFKIYCCKNTTKLVMLLKKEETYGVQGEETTYAGQIT